MWQACIPVEAEGKDAGLQQREILRLDILSSGLVLTNTNRNLEDTAQGRRPLWVW